MVIIFVLLGLGFLAGGAAAIVDGWPYLILERGFTEVIIGSIAVTAGVILLALARVLVELRRVKAALMAGVPVSAAVADKRAALPAATPADPSAGIGAGAIIAGAGLAAAGGALAASLTTDGATDQPGEADERDAAALGDLFDETASAAPEQPPLEGAMPGPTPETAEPSPASTPEAGLDMVMPVVEPITMEPVLQTERAPDIDPPIPSDDEPERQAEPWWPSLDRARDEATLPAREGDTLDDLSSLREHLTRGPLWPEVDSEATAADTETSSGDAIDTASSWMSSIRAGREPVLPAAEPLEGDSTPWPDRALSLSGDGEQSAPAVPIVDIEEVDDEAIAHIDAAKTADAVAEAHEPEMAAGRDDDTPPEPAAPAASDEGIVGAYQVGDTHFTMYAGGSIRARTPEGEYDFASMDELKTYLASEKSRLGV